MSMKPPHPGGKSCYNCPQNLTSVGQIGTMGRGIGGNLCPLKLLAIGRPGTATSQPVTQAKKCDSYGTPKAEMSANALRAAIEIPVAFPTVITEEPKNPAMVNSCLDCEHFIPEGIVTALTGWKTAMCGARGALILSDRLGTYASRCPTKSRAGKSLSVFNPDDVAKTVINLLPEYREGFGKVDPLAEFKRNSSINPRTYPTDNKVSGEADRIGVRAWRKIEDPKGRGKTVFLPIFDYDRLPVSQQAIVPSTGDDEHPEWYVDHGGWVYKLTVMWTKLIETPAIWGPAGVGKTELFRHMAWLMCLPFERVSITGSTELDDIAGKMMYTPEKGTYFHYGRIPLAWQKPNVLCLDEPNVGPPDVWQFLRPLTDDSKQLVLDQNVGERITAHPGCYLGMAMNPAWDARNVGAAVLGDADGSRLMHLYMGLPPAEVEKSIIMRRVMADKWDERQAETAIKTVMLIAAELRKLGDDGVLPISWGIRSQIKVTRLLPYMSFPDAYRAAVVASLEPQAAQAVLDVVNQYVREDD